jgi:hypothetical protein
MSGLNLQGSEVQPHTKRLQHVGATDRLDIARFAVLGDTDARTPHAHQGNRAVEILNVCAPSPPRYAGVQHGIRQSYVPPATSRPPQGRAISSMVSPFIRSANDDESERPATGVA